MMRLLLIAFFLEVGFVLAVVPWSAYWDRNYFAELIPPLHDLITNNYVRGAVTGIGIVNVLAGIYELFGALLSRSGDEHVISINHSTPAEE